MREAHPDLVTWLAGPNPIAHRCDLVTLTIPGTTYRWTTWGADLTVQNYTRRATEGALLYRAPPVGGIGTWLAPIVTVGQEDEGEGLGVCSLELTLSGEGFKIGTRSLMVAAADGLLDGATVIIDHLIMPSAGDVSLQSFTDFDGRVSEPDIGVNEVTLRCKSWLETAETTLLPRRVFSPACQWEHFGTECGLSRAANRTSGTITYVNATNAFHADTVEHNHGWYNAEMPNYWNHSVTETRGWWDLGVIYWDSTTDAALAGTKSNVLSSDGTGLVVLAEPPAGTLTVGDTFYIEPGCNQDVASCVRYSNVSRYGGFRFIPSPDTTPVR